MLAVADDKDGALESIAVNIATDSRRYPRSKGLRKDTQINPARSKIPNRTVTGPTKTWINPVEPYMTQNFA